MCATVLSRFTQDQSLTIRHAIWAAMTLALLFLVAKEIPKTLILACFGGYLIFAATSLFWATNRIKGVYEIAKIALMTVSFVVAYWVLQKDRGFIVKAMTVLGLLIGVYCLYEIVSIGDVNLRLGTMGVRNLWASSQLLLLPLCVLSIRKWKYVGAGVSGLIVLNLILLHNRASILALIVAALVAVFYIKRLRKFIIAGLVCLIIVCVIRPQYLNTQSLKNRLVLWNCTLKIFRENPFWGTGINNWELEFPRYAKDMLALDEKILTRNIYQRPHNDYLWVLSETGIFGLICYGGIFVLGIYYAAKTRNITALAGLSGYMVIAVFSFPKERAFHSMMLIFYLADALPACKTIKLPRFVWCPITLVLCLIVAEFGLCYSGERHIRKMAIARDRREWSKVLTEAGKVPFVRTLDPFTLPVKWYTGEAHYFLGNHKQAVLDTAEAFGRSPNNIYVLDRMGSMLEGLGDFKGAEYCYRRALTIHPKFGYSRKKLINLMAKNG